MASTTQVTGLSIYPVKSLAGIQLQDTYIDSMGLQYDRRWMVVSPEGKFLTQRTIPQMALIHTALDENGKLTLSKEGKESHNVPTTDDTSPKMDVVVWRDSLQVSRVGDETDAWLKEALGFDCHLVYIADDVLRQCDLDFSKEGDRTGFADGFPILLVSEESLQDLNDRLESPVDMRRFRPNITVSGLGAFGEDELKDFTVGGVEMKGVKVCSRCPLPTVDPDKGERAGQEPIATLMTYRKWDSKVYFGMNVIHQQQGKIRVGDSLVIKC